MEKAIQLLSSSKNEEKIAGIMILNQILAQITAGFEEKHGKEGSPSIEGTIDRVLGMVYQKVSPVFIVNLCLTKKFPSVQKQAIEFLTNHLLVPSTLHYYFDYVKEFTEVCLEQENLSEVQNSLLIVLKQIIATNDSTLFTKAVNAILNSPSSAPPPPLDLKNPSPSAKTESPVHSNHLEMMIALCESISISSSALSPSKPLFDFSTDQLNRFLRLLLPGLHGAAPEKVRDQWLQYSRELLGYSNTGILASSWIYCSLPGASSSSSFLLFLLSVVMNEIHLVIEELLCGFHDLLVDPSQAEAKDIASIQQRYLRAYQTYLLCLELLEELLQVLLSALELTEKQEEDNNDNNRNTNNPSRFPLQGTELMNMQQRMQQIAQEILSFVIDGGAACTSLLSALTSREKQSYFPLLSLLRSAMTKSLHYLRLYRREDDSYTEKLLSERSKLLSSSLLVSSSSPAVSSFQLDQELLLFPIDQALFFSSSTSSSTSNNNRTSSQQSPDPSLCLLLLFEDIVSDFSNHLIHEEEQAQLDQLIDIHGSLLSFTLSYLRSEVQSFSEERQEEDEDQRRLLVRQGICAGLQLTDQIILMKYSTLKDLLVAEGGNAFYNVIGCSKDLVRDLYALLRQRSSLQKKETAVNSDLSIESEVRLLIEKVKRRIESLALEDGWVDTLE